VLQCIYEEDFLGFSYGFRPDRSQHQALDALAYAIYEKRVNWVLDAGIQGFFDEINRGWLIKFLEHRIGDGRMLRLIRKWLSAGIIEGTDWSDTATEDPSSVSERPISRSTSGKSRMREFFTYGSVRGAAGNGRPYRDPPILPQRELGVITPDAP
jgi:hypothetical protein